MKNLKKILSLVLALAMALSLMTAAFAADASDYKDYSKVTYNEAVDVMTAAGIFQGNNGNFDPNGTLTREQAAKIIAYMLVGQEKADKLTATIAPYSDVAANRWSAGAIAYCKNEGIIAGTGNGKFSPTAELTGLQFAKMLLVALGYDATIEKLEGASWAINTSKLALGDPDLDNGMENVSLSKVLTREEAAQMAFNTMKATLVEYNDKGDNITVGGITINTGASKATPVTSKVKADATSISADKTTDGLYTVEFSEKYCDKLVAKEGTADDFGRPATEWKYDGDEIGTYADDADDSMVVNKTLKGDAVLSTNSDYFGYAKGDFADTVNAYVNGDPVKGVKGFSTLDQLDIQAGDEVEVYENDDDDIATIVVIRYELAIIDEINTNLSSTYTKKGANCSITLEALDENVSIGGTYYDHYTNDSAKELAGFAADTYKEGTALAVAMKGNVVLASHVATSAQGKISGYDSGSKANVTVDGTKYPLHANIMTASNTSVANNALSNNFNYNDSTYTVYTDKNGYVIGIDETESVKIEDVYYVTGLATEDGKYSNSYYAQAVALTDGKVVEFKIKTSDEDTQKAFFGAKATEKSFDDVTTGKVYTNVAGLYTFDKDGSKYTAQQYLGKDAEKLASYQTNDSTYYVYADSDRTSATIGDDLEKSDTSMKVAGSKVYLNDKTQYIKVEDTGDDIDVKTVVGGTNVKKTNGQNETTAIAVATKSNSNYVASYVILVSNDFANTSSDDVVFVSGSSNKTVSYTDADGKTQKGYQVDLYFMDGSGKVESNATITKDSNKGAGYYTYVINDDGVYELSTGVDGLKLTDAYDDETGFVSKTTLTGIYNNALTIPDVNSQKVEDVDFADKVIIADDRGSATIDKDLYNSEVTSVSQLKAAIDKKGNTVTADVYFDDGKVVMVYVWSMTKAPNSGDTGDKDATIKSVELSDAGAITVNLNKAATADTKYDVTVQKYIEAQDKWVDAATATVTVVKGADKNTAVTVKLATGGIYRAISGNVISNSVTA